VVLSLLTSGHYTETLQAARGIIPAQLLLKNAKLLEVHSGQWVHTDIAVHHGRVVGLDSGYTAHRTIDLKGAAVVPGFIDAHVHIESSCMVPGRFEQAVLARGTTSAICDPHELANVLGVEGLTYFLDCAEKTNLDLHVMLSSCVPATHLETNGGGTITAAQLAALKDRSRALGLAEVMNVPGVLNRSPEVHAKLEAFSDRPIDGHAPQLRGKDLSAYAACGISSCHESSELSEAQEKLLKGMAVWIREGSVAKDLDALLPILNAYSSATVGFCTDDRNPLDIEHEGHIDHLVRKALRSGVPSESVYRAASYSVARHYGLREVGAVTPGRWANIIVLDDAPTCAIRTVYLRGTPVQELAFDDSLTRTNLGAHSIRAAAPTEAELTGPKGRVHVIGAIEGKIITTHSVADSTDSGIARLSVLERYGHGHKPANGYVSGFGASLNGAIASSVGHDSHNLIVVGNNTGDMRAALAHLIKTGGGFCVVQNAKVLADLALPVGGLMTPAPTSEIVTKLRSLRTASRTIGCELSEPFLQLAFLSLPVIPKLKLTDRGLIDVEQFKIISVSA